MALNILELLNQFKQFENALKTSGKDPQSLLESELKKRNISPQQFNELLEKAKTLSKLFGLK